MGIFSSKKKYTVNVTVANVFDKTQIPNSAMNGIIKGIMKDSQIVENMLEDVSGSIGARAAIGYNWLSKENYALGLPNSALKTYISAQSQVLQAIAANIGQTIVPEYYYMGPLNSMHFGWQHCFNALGYNPETNELTGLAAETGFKCYLADIKATYLREDYDWMVESNDMGMLAQMGPSPTSGWLPSAPFNTLQGIGQYAKQPAYEVSDVATEDYVTITYEFKNAGGAFVRRGITVSMAAFDNVADFHMCRYKRADGKTGFFTYQQGAGTYPLIDQAMLFQMVGLGSYLPWAYFRQAGQDIYSMQSASTMRKMVKWCEYIGVNFAELHSGVHQDPNVGDVEQCIMMFAATPGDTNPACIEYLFKYFSWLHANSQSQGTLVNGLYEKMQAFTSSPSQALRIGDNGFGMTFQYSGILKQTVPGKIGPVGTYTSSYAQVSQNSQEFLTQGVTGVGRATSAPTQPGWVYRRQILDSMYEEVAVYGLRVDYEVHRKKGFAAGENDSRLLIPVDFAIMRTMGLPQQEQMLCNTLRLMVNTVIVTETKWYQSGIMKAILVVVAVVITIFTAGSAWATIAAAAALGATALAVTIVTILVQALAVSYGIKLFVKELGPKAGFIAAVVAVLAAAYGASTDATWANALLSIGNGLTQEAASATADMVQDVLNELTDFQAWAAGELDNLKEKREELQLNPMFVGLGAFDVVQLAPEIVFGESPTAYYDRTVHSGNIGVASLDFTEFYVDSMLTLPELQHVDGDFYDGSIPTA